MKITLSSLRPSFTATRQGTAGGVTWSGALRCPVISWAKDLEDGTVPADLESEGSVYRWEQKKGRFEKRNMFWPLFSMAFVGLFQSKTIVFYIIDLLFLLKISTNITQSSV